MPHELTDHAEASLIDPCLDRLADVTQPLPGARLPGPRHESRARHTKEAIHLGIDLAHGNRDGSVGEVPVQTHAHIDAQDVA